MGRDKCNEVNCKHYSTDGCSTSVVGIGTYALTLFRGGAKMLALHLFIKLL